MELAEPASLLSDKQLLLVCLDDEKCVNLCWNVLGIVVPRLAKKL